MFTETAKKKMELINTINAARKLNKCDSTHTVFNGNVIKELLVNGNSKIGKNVYHFSTLPTCENGGTCFCTCEGCYGTKGNYNFVSTRKALTLRTNIVRSDLNWFIAEIIREILSHKIKYVRIHATGDFFSKEYTNAWIIIASVCKDTKFWTYTKSYGHGFDDTLNTLNSLPNVNIVQSLVPGCGFNFGHCEYVLDTYYKLISQGENPYICPCGTDDTVHCNECHKCSERKYVLFLEHSTGYKADKDSLFNTVAAIVANQ